VLHDQLGSAAGSMLNGDKLLITNSVSQELGRFGMSHELDQCCWKSCVILECQCYDAEPVVVELKNITLFSVHGHRDLAQ
jgi:hypothetical protein